MKFYKKDKILEKLKENSEFDIENLKFQNDGNLEKELLEKYNIKLDSDESVFYKFTCHSKFWLFVELFCFLVAIIGCCGVIVTGTIFYKIGCLVLLLFLLFSVFPYAIKNFINIGFFITNKRLITLNGISNFLDDVYFKDCNHKRGYYGIDLYENSTFILCVYDTTNGFDNLLALLHKLTSNDIILQFKTNNDKRISIEKTKLKLINN